MSKMELFKLIFVCISILRDISSKTIGPDMVARARLLRDLPLGRTLSGQDRVLPKSRERTLIELNLSLRSIDLNFSSGTLVADGWMSLKWNDPRYSWEPSDYEDLTSMPLPFSTSWAPEVILHNAVEEKFIYRQVGIVRHNGDFVYLVSIHTKSSCAPNYNSFPFGVQTCQLKFGSWVNEQYKVEYRAGNGNSSSSVNSDINLDEFNSPTGWQIVAAEANLESAQYPLFEEPSHMVVYTISFKRDIYFDTNTGTLKRKEDIIASTRKSRHEI